MPCATVDVQESDVSTATVSISSLQSNEPGKATLVYEVDNQIQSGSGEQVTITVQTTVDGSAVDERDVTVSAGSSTQHQLTLSGLSGTAEVCVEVV